MRADREIEAGARSFGEGLLVELVAALREVHDGQLVGVTAAHPAVGAEIALWSKLTGHALVSVESEGRLARYVVRKGVGRIETEPPLRPIGSRLWLYSNFDCNLRCDYCCVRSSPTTARRELGLERAARIAAEAVDIGTEAFFVTGGEPFILADVGEILEACAQVAPTTVLTNAMLFSGARLERLRALRRDVTLQISLDSPGPDLHDLHRGKGSWSKALAGVRLARELGFRVRLAATVASDEAEARFRAFLDGEAVAEDDRIVRRVALRGFASEGIALSKSDLVPEVTITAAGVYWHPVGADDADFLVTTDIFPLADAVAAVRSRWEEERRVHDEVAAVFHCA